jgi:hypothetical protein
MKNKLVSVMFVLGLMLSVALAQVDQATGTVTNDETHARLRVSNCVFGGPEAAIFLDGEVAMNNGIPQASVPALATWGYFQGFTATRVGYGSSILVVLLVITFAMAFVYVKKFRMQDDH